MSGSPPFAENFLQTYALPLAAFESDWHSAGATIDSIAIRFAGEGLAFLDDVGLEPPVQIGD